jgi:hypothetical protein
VGQPHGRSGDKMKRKMAAGLVGLRHGRGPHAGLFLNASRARKPRR